MATTKPAESADIIVVGGGEDIRLRVPAPTIAVVGIVALLVCAAAEAHHSTAMFMWGKEVTIEGTIDKYEWTQPHAFIWLNSPGKGGQTMQWGFEGMSPSWLGRRGWNSQSLATGEKVQIVYYPLKDGQPGGFFVRVTQTTGKTLESFPRQTQTTSQSQR